jgi:isopenicillin-N N-acyltransferase like protein
LNPFYVMHLYGNATERGYAHGQLFAEKIVDFVENELPQYYKQEIAGLNLGGLPKWLQNIIKSIGKGASGEVAKIALGYILKTQRKYLEASKANVFDEMSAIARGVCSKIPNTKSNACKNGDATNLINTIEQVNMLPELIRMQCSMMGAWGESTAAGKLLQLRTLDFGGGPFGNRTMLIVNHPEKTSGNPAFATVGFPAFVGAVTGFSENIGLCEKVDDVTKPKPVPKGSYNGQADSFVIRDVIEFAKTKEDGISILKSAHRTWPIWIGLGDYASQEFNAMEYTQEVVHVYNDQTLPTATNQTKYENVAYIDKHPQPSPHIDMPGLVKEYYGTMTAKNVVQNFPRMMESGDVHIALYDFGEKQAYIAVGVTNSTGAFVRKAYESPFIQFDMSRLWSES